MGAGGRGATRRLLSFGRLNQLLLVLLQLQESSLGLNSEKAMALVGIVERSAKSMDFGDCSVGPRPWHGRRHHGRLLPWLLEGLLLPSSMMHPLMVVRRIGSGRGRGRGDVGLWVECCEPLLLRLEGLVVALRKMMSREMLRHC